MAVPDPVSADKIKPEEVNWLWRQRIPRRMITIVGGRPDQGKGLFVCHLAAHVTNTRYKAVGGGTRWGRVLISSIEESPTVMTRPRLQAAGAKLENVDLWRFRLPAQIEELEDHVTWNGIDLIVIDPLASHLSSRVSRYNDSIREVTDPLAAVLERTGAACVVIEHVLKRVSQSGDPLQAIGGSSSGIVAACRMGYLFGKDPKDSDVRYLCCVKSNLSERPDAIEFELDVKEVEFRRNKLVKQPALLYKGDTTYNPMNFLSSSSFGGRSVGRPADKLADACEFLANYLVRAGKPVRAADVVEDAKQHGISEKTLVAARKRLDVIVDPPGGGRYCKWAASDEMKRDLAGDIEPDRNPEMPDLSISDEEFTQLLGDFNVDQDDQNEEAEDGNES